MPMAVGPRLAMQLPSTILTPPPTTQQKQQGIGFGGGRGRGWSWSATQFVPASCRSSSQRRRRHGPPASPPPPSRRQRWGEGGGGAVNDTQDDVVKKEEYRDKRQPRQEMAVDAASQNGRTVACSSEASWTSRSGLLSGHALVCRIGGYY
ncbi:hypothetical protein OsJ_18640 [Oryza sativa Japonica Group]|uniref:Uncharacterized protein n=1 Tax=Oryza sativa subsp. japonica TaxID=39947 RepID=B9FPR4_ORYSJ|nr:hypothetical protein OsJ_18640 [Oryza sativa Japonica Group]